MKVVDPKFPGLEGLKDFGFIEEWYALGNFSDDLHVILVQDTDSMKAKGEKAYQRAPYPATWAKPYADLIDPGEVERQIAAGSDHFLANYGVTLTNSTTTSQ